MLRKFGFLIAGVAVAGLVLALWADDGASNSDAWREVGGAVVSGAVLAGLVVWFEDRREDQREMIASDRADVAAAEAWQREIDIRLVTLIRTDLMLAREAWRYRMGYPGRPFAENVADISALLDIQEHNSLTEAWNKWLEFINFTTLDAYNGPSQVVDDNPQWSAVLTELITYLDRSYR